jgi:signal transduction histidine kinase
MLVAIATLTAIGKISSPRFFVIYLESIEVQGIQIRQIRKDLVRGFEIAWSRGAIWSIMAGAGTAAGLSYWVAQRIVKPLEQMEDITQKFAAGKLDERVPDNAIPELSQLASSFNRMASSLEGVEQRRRDLVSDLTHELRTPLTILKGYLEGLADGTIEPSPAVYQTLARETARMQRLVDDVQELSKMEAGYLSIKAQPTELCPLLDSLVQRFADQLTSQEDLQFHLHCPAELPLVMADPERIEQIMVNLLGNALRYTPKGTITVEVWRGKRLKNFLWIAVSDTGQGIAPEDLPHVFERFWRADRSRDRHSGGAGIGLAICRRLVELQGGTIQAESELGQGSTFKFSLPIIA